MWKQKDFDRFFVGFDPLVKRFADAAETATKAASNYPPYNIKKTGENRYVIEIGVAGFARQDLDIELVDGTLNVRGSIQGEFPGEEQSTEWPKILFNGLATRPFTRTFNLADNVTVKSGELVNGVLKIWLEAITPESKKVKIDIQDAE